MTTSGPGMTRIVAGESQTPKRRRALEVLNELGFRIYDSGSAFYIWARIPEGYSDAMQLNEALIRGAEVAGVPGSAFSDRDDWDGYMRLCIAREDEVLESAFSRLRKALSPAPKNRAALIE